MSHFILLWVTQVTLVSLAAVSVMLLSPRHPAWRYAVGLVGLLMIVVSPLSIAVLPRSRSLVPTGWQQPPASGEVVSREATTSMRGGVEQFANPRIERHEPESNSEAINLSTENRRSTLSLAADSFWGWGGALWCLGTVAALGRWLWQSWRLHRLTRLWQVEIASARRSHDALPNPCVAHEAARTIGLSKVPEILVSNSIPLAMVTGVFRPRVWLPSWALHMGNAALRDVLLHEFAHVLRRDCLGSLAIRLVSICWWWHPGVLCLNRLLGRAREEVCDNFVLQHSDAATYASTLLQLTERCTSNAQRLAPAMGLLGRKWTLEARIRGLLHTQRDTMTKIKRWQVVAIVTGLGWLMSGVGGVGSAEDELPAVPLPVEVALPTAPLRVADARPAGALQEKVATVDAPSTTAGSAAQPIDEQSPTPAFKTIQGRIVDEQLRPVEKARIWWQVSFGTPGTIENTLTDAQGRFQLSTPDVPLADRMLELNLLWVLAEKNQLAVMHVTSDHLSGAECQIQLEPIADTSFVVLSPTGHPVPGMRVIPFRYDHSLFPEPIQELLSSISDREGRVQMPRLGREHLVGLRVDSPEYGIQELRLDGAALSAERPIHLRACGGIEGRLLADNPAWVRGLRLMLETRDDAIYDPRGKFVRWKTVGYAFVTADEQGRFHVPTIAAGPLRILVESVEGEPVLPRLSKNEMVIEGKVNSLDIAFEPPVVVRGTVYADDTGKPIPDATVFMSYGVGSQGAKTVTGPEGSFEVKVLSGAMSVWAGVFDPSHPFDGYQQVGGGRLKPIQIPAGEPHFDLPALQLVAPTFHHGILVDGSGKPVADALVRCAHAARFYGSSKTNSQGEFTIRVPETLPLDDFSVSLDGDKRVSARVRRTVDKILLQLESP